MEPLLRLISTDFDGTVFSESEDPPVPHALQGLLADLKAGGAQWVINTGRDFASLESALAGVELATQPDFLVLVERDIYLNEGGAFLPLEGWNHRCNDDHARLFETVRPDVTRLRNWIETHHQAHVYEDAWSPLCFVAGSHRDAEAIHSYLLEYCRDVPDLTVMRNDVYARFSHARYHKGTALAEIARRRKIPPDAVFAAGDHLNDLPMLSREFARWLVAPANAVPEVKHAVRSQGGHVSSLPAGRGVEEGLRRALAEPDEPALAGRPLPDRVR